MIKNNCFQSGDDRHRFLDSTIQNLFSWYNSGTIWRILPKYFVRNLNCQLEEVILFL